MPGVSSTESRSPRPILSKRSFADFDEPDPSSSRPGTTKRLRIETEEAEQEAKTVQQQPKPLPLKRPHASFLEDFVDPLPSSPAPRRYRPESVDSFVAQWVESGSELDRRSATLGSELESYRERHSRSDTLLGHSDRDLIPRRLTKSAPNMEFARDSEGFVVPPTPPLSHSFRADAEYDSRFDSQVDSQASLYAASVAPSDMSGASSGSGRKNLVENPYYRQTNLATNNIYIRDFYEEFPEDIAGLVDHVRKDRDSPGLSSDQLWQNTRLFDLEMGTAEPAVENYFKANIFPDPGRSDSLKRTDRNPMAKYVVPEVGSMLKVSIPVPDMLYGYNRPGAFTHGQQTQLISIGNEMVANTQDLILPFFVIEFKADGPGGSGSMWVATNQCLGGSASCVNIAERLNRRLKQCQSDEVRPIDSAAFSIAMNGTEARLYISWKHDQLDYYMRRVKSFALQEPEQYVDFLPRRPARRGQEENLPRRPSPAYRLRQMIPRVAVVRSANPHRLADVTAKPRPYKTAPAEQINHIGNWMPRTTVISTATRMETLPGRKIKGNYPQRSNSEERLRGNPFPLQHRRVICPRGRPKGSSRKVTYHTFAPY